ncbi:Gfo/Idh/MocA family protein [Hoeflea poritis]|uniref:Gfo/Idh/MocA family oxidoreductase n=1 Tax=Hoeflea poritis TaxID=2993659 RepID=A0ABT4VJS4_9HYPH|nr:Gfo/Idh/MocA family oxidoreductase [Hoeflea poritis]MDA4844966.1 Gfo/Idh/MocA family oxidoreductase [Hoeflea poritis]
MTDEKPDTDTYALTAAETARVDAPQLKYRPPQPLNYRPRIALVGAGGISAAHLDAYRTAGLDIAVICSQTLANAVSRRDEFFPQAIATDNYDEVLKDSAIEVVDITTHPAERVALIEAALKAGKHVLSQKPFVLDLDTGERLVQLAGENGVFLAVNQNGRWAPHLSYMREAVKTGLIGDLISCHIAIHWDHGWIRGTAFEKIEDLVFYDFAIHWFDFLASIAGDRARSVFAMKARARGQEVAPPLLAQCLVQLDGGQASLVFDAATRFGPQDATYIAGTKGSLSSAGPDLGRQRVTLTTGAGRAEPELEGQWFNDGFRGAMGELLCAIEEGRAPLNAASGNLKSLELAFSAIESARTGRLVEVSTVRRLPG